MALVEIEFIKSTFESTAGFVVRTGPAVPVPTLSAIGDDRLILTFNWRGDPLIDTGFPGFVPPSGSILLRHSVALTHSSLAEIKLKPNTPGTGLTGVAWILATVTASQAVLTLVGFDAGKGAVALVSPEPLGILPYPIPEGIKVAAATLVADNSTTTLRLATSPLDNLLQPPANRLPALLAEPGAASANWLIHIPADLFTDLILEPMLSFLSPPPAGITIEESPRASWIQDEGGAWGVLASAGLKKIDGCPGLFSDVDISVELTASARFIENPPESRVDIGLTIEVNASDWDSFRCWLGGAFLVSLGFADLNPYDDILDPISSLTTVSEVIRREVGSETSDVKIPNFTKVSNTASTVSYSGSFPIDPLPHTWDVTFALGPTGLNIQGMIAPIGPDHETSFNPALGPLTGGWTSKINCSQRAMDHAFAYQDVIVSDNLSGSVNRGLPVKLFGTSSVEPAGKCWIDMANPRPDLPVRIKAPGMREGDAGFAVLHTSAGLRAYALSPVPGLPSEVLDTQHLINAFCDTFRVPVRTIDVHELKWIEPPPDYNWGHDPLRQWQIIVQGLDEDQTIEVHANAADGVLLATRTDFLGRASRTAIEVVTDATTDLVIRAPAVDSDARVTLATRWLLPQHRATFDSPVRSFSKSSSMLNVRTDASEWTFYLDGWRSRPGIRPASGLPHVIDREGETVSLGSGRVALIHYGDLVIATALNTLTQGDT